MEPFVALMRRYVVDYTNSHDLAVCDEIMEPDYVLRMGPHVVAGRDDAYKPATRRQLEQFPGLGLTVHEVVTNGSAWPCASPSTAPRYARRGLAVWGGIGLYAWNGRRLTTNRVEQDYLARRRQLAEGVPDAVPPPAPAPWDTVARAPDPAADRAARAWAEQGCPPSATSSSTTAGNPRRSWSRTRWWSTTCSPQAIGLPCMSPCRATSAAACPGGTSRPARLRHCTPPRW